mmetsp:Transcript_3606/g.8026  ORF Transcript_3606/g.8026 Transcript_3606/m.8026 type:complete len:102 (-) Transcript_3606:1517-1822(-)
MVKISHSPYCRSSPKDSGMAVLTTSATAVQFWWKEQYLFQSKSPANSHHLPTHRDCMRPNHSFEIRVHPPFVNSVPIVEGKENDPGCQVYQSNLAKGDILK